MNNQSAQTPTERGNVTLTLSPSEQDALMRCLCLIPMRQLTVHDACYLENLSNKLKFLLPNIGDACRHSAHIPEFPGQGGNLLDLPMNRVSVPPSAISGDCNCSNTDAWRCAVNNHLSTLTCPCGCHATGQGGIPLARENGYSSAIKLCSSHPTECSIVFEQGGK